MTNIIDPKASQLMSEFAEMANIIHSWIIERELHNLLAIVEPGLSENPTSMQKTIQQHGEHIKYKDPFESEFKWRDEVVLRFKGEVNVFNSVLTIGVQRCFLSAVEPVYYNFKITADGVEMV